MEEQSLTKKERKELKRRQKEADKLRRTSSRLIKRLVFWGIGIGAVILISFGLSKLSVSPSNQGTVSEILAITSVDQIKGSPNALATLIEYSDFQCPACGAYYPILKQLNQEFSDRLRFIYRHFPLRQIHQNAELAARAAEAAGKQEKFWEMHDLLLENQKEWSEKTKAEDVFINYAQSFNLDIERFKNDIDSKEVKVKTKNDYQGGVNLGVNATPTFFLNGQKLQNPGSYDEFKKVIQEAINQ